MALRRWGAALLLGLTAVVASGCPAVLEDDFRLQPSSTAGSGEANAGSAGETSAQGGSSQSGSAAGESGASDGGSGAGTGTAGGGGAPAAGGEGGASGGGPCDCAAHETCCEGQCVDLRYDAANCRSCGNKCPGTTCDNASCTNTCAQGRIDCNHNVVDGCEVNPATDPTNCGNCDIACGFQLECVGGNCVCPTGTADCDGVAGNGCEVDTSSDAASCGGCGKACSVREGCVAGSCECQPGFADCNQVALDGCEATLTDATTCGSCTFDCGAHSTCVAAGQCGCLAGYLDCDASIPGCETPTTDPLHCGSCDNACSPALPACDGVACSTGCGALTKCGSSCVDTQQDPQNCGGCGKPVGLNQICVDGQPECLTGYGDCDGNPSDCEVNTDADPTHCGDCATACKSGALCSAGSCACAPTTPNDCGGSCQKCCDNAQCSDGNSCTADTCNGGVCSSGTACAAGGVCCAGTGCFECCGDSDCSGGQICTGNKCSTLVCTPPLIACNSKCVNPTTDATNCGSCGNNCGPGRSCSASGCTPKWVGTAVPPLGFVARQRAAYTAMGSKVFIWGGSNALGTALADGAIYDPSSDTWTTVATAGSPPSARILATAVWTGSVVVVWGGGDVASNSDYTSGSRFDPASGSWQAITTVGAPAGRRGAYGFWTGSRVLLYGGLDEAGQPSATLSLYDPVNDKWSATTFSRPSARSNITVGWTGSQLLFYGGQPAGTGPEDQTHGHDVAGNVWIRYQDGPSNRYGAFGTWDGTYLVAWGGASPTVRDDGRYFQPNGDVWTNMAGANEPSARWAPHRQTGWSARIKPGQTLMLGGLGSTSTTYFTNGGVYNSTTNAWSTVGAWPSTASHLWGVGVWTGAEFVLWGGRATTGGTLTIAGDRYLP